MSNDAIASWRARRERGKNGHPFVFSDSCIILLGVLREVYGLPLRQTVGLATSLLQLMGVVLPVPNYATLSRRLGAVTVPLTRRPLRGPLVIVIDSTGVKVSGEGSWKVRMHGKAHATKWRKLHVMTNGKRGTVLEVTVTDAARPDWQQLASLVATIPHDVKVGTVLADGAYDVRPVRKVVAERGAAALIPPRKDAILHPTDVLLAERNKAIQAIHSSSRSIWMTSSGYHQRSRIEATMWRYKAIFGERMRSRTDQGQEAQLRLRSLILNRFLALGMPRYLHAPATDPKAATA